MTTRTERLRGPNGNLNILIAEAKAPVAGTLVCLHGGPGGDYRGNDGIFDDLRSYCTNFGYNIVQFDMFGAGASDGHPEDITLRSQVGDYESVLAYAQVAFPGDLHIVGESMGATIAALTWKENVTSYLLLWPAFDLRDTDLRPYLSEPWTSRIAEQGYVDDNGSIVGREFLKEIAHHDFTPCFALPQTPCLIVHGKRDSAVPFQQSLDAVRAAAGECVLFAHPGGDHGLQRPEERDFTRKAIQWWLSRWSK